MLWFKYKPNDTILCPTQMEHKTQPLYTGNANKYLHKLYLVQSHSIIIKMTTFTIFIIYKLPWYISYGLSRMHDFNHNMIKMANICNNILIKNKNHNFGLSLISNHAGF